MRKYHLWTVFIIAMLLISLLLGGCSQKTETSEEVQVSQEAAETSVEVEEETVQPVVVEFQLADLYSQADGLFVVPGYPWSEHENPGEAVAKDYNVALPVLYDPEPEIIFSFQAGEYQLESAPVFSTTSGSSVMDIHFSSEGVENVPEKTDALVNDLTKLFGEPEVQDIHDGGSDDEVYEWAHKWTANSGESKTILSVFSYHTEETEMNYEFVLHLQKS